MRASDQGFFRQLGSVAGYMAGLALLFIGFVALLGFPWRWVLPTVVVLEVLAILLVLRVEYSARRVDGASGWMTFGFLFGHAWLFGGAALLRLAVWLWQHFVH
ncbi:hypothetical protein [Bordetella genomosp. 12]|nr:hypothetical protein [Bordetella genomosp. 12]